MLAVVDTLAGEEPDTVVPADRVRRVANEEGGVAKGAAWLTEFWAEGRTRAWVLGQTPFLHAYGHYFEARAVRGMWGTRASDRLVLTTTQRSSQAP